MKHLLLAVLDCLIPLNALAGWLYLLAIPVVRRRRPFIIGITGSVGKTTTTEMLAYILKQPEVERRLGKVGQVINNMNDDVGLPATLLLFNDLKEGYPPSRLRTALIAPWRALQLSMGWMPYPTCFVLEFGAGWGGHIARLAQLAPPNIAVVTTIGPSHLERFHTIEGVAKEKISLVRVVPSNGLVVLGAGHAFVDRFREAAASPVITVGGEGRTLAENITKAVCQHLQIPDGLVKSGLLTFQLPRGRLNILRFGRLTIIDDSYNANPISMKHALDELVKIATPSDRKIAILGFMAELGAAGPEYHQEIGRYARARVDLLIGIGELAKNYAPDLWYVDSEACAEQINTLLQENDCILIKGSGSAATRKIVEKLRQAAINSVTSTEFNLTTEEATNAS